MMNDAARQQDRLRPSLLERLTDDAPTQKVEARDRRQGSEQRLRESVLRDLGWLMNCASLESQVDLDDYPFVKASVINFGVPEFSGVVLATLDAPDLEERIRTAILRFEPRIIPESLVVRCRTNSGTMSVHSLAFDIKADVRADPMPLPLALRTQIDVESNDVIITEQAR